MSIISVMITWINFSPKQLKKQVVLIGVVGFFSASIQCYANKIVSCEDIFKNTYTLENTFKKYHKKYPSIIIPDQSTPKDIKHSKNIAYKIKKNRPQRCHKSESSALTLDVYQPRNQLKPLPLIVLVHGGGWRMGHPSLLKALAIGLAEHGYIVATPNYRLSGEAAFPAGVTDIADAIDWLKNNSERFLINKEKIVLAGSSAGGQIASLLAYSQHNFTHDSPGKEQLKVQALINIDGLSNFTSPQALPFENNPKKAVTAASVWLGGKYEVVPELWETASPINYIDENSPPTLFIISSRPRFSAGKEEVVAALTKHNIASEIYKTGDSPHSFWLFHPWLEKTVSASVAFMKKINIH
ncbi:MAG: alpha/beta hydrolase [Colwellia sp.]